MKLTPLREAIPHVEFRVKEIDGELYAVTEEHKNMTYWYLASPYSKYPGGLEEAFAIVCRNAALLVQNKVPVFCPIAHTHPLAVHGQLDPYDHDIWLPADEPMMHSAKGLIILAMDGWRASKGVRVEREFFQAAGKPEIFMDPGIIPYGLLAASHLLTRYA